MDRSRWTTDDAGRVFGRDLHDAVPADARPAWAAAVLAACAEGAARGPTREAIDELLTCAAAPERWPQARRAFDALRELTLAAERALVSASLDRALLDLGETVAKLTYNASGAPAPYDFHAGWRLAPKTRRVVELREDPGLADRVWTLLTEPAARAT